MNRQEDVVLLRVWIDRQGCLNMDPVADQQKRNLLFPAVDLLEKYATPGVRDAQDRAMRDSLVSVASPDDQPAFLRDFTEASRLQLGRGAVVVVRMAPEWVVSMMRRGARCRRGTKALSN